ncbi:MAG: ribosome silencing factor [Pseudomonadota bacterium]
MSINTNFLTAKLTELKATDIVVINIGHKSDIADSMIVATATSARHAVAVASKICTELKHHDLGIFKPQGTENGNWVVIDAGSVIIHIFQAETRNEYQLEQLWKQRPSQ